MRVLKPEDIHRAFVEAFNARDLNGLLDLYAPDAVFIWGADGAVVGHAAISQAFSELLKSQGSIRLATGYCYTNGDLALLQSRWEILGTEGEVMARGASAEVARRQADGAWRYVIDHPSGGDSPK